MNDKSKQDAGAGKDVAKPENAAASAGNGAASAQVTQDAAVSAGNDVVVAELMRQVNSMGTAMVPLGQYLEAEGLLERQDGVPLTVGDIADAALQALKERKAQLIETGQKVEELTPVPDKKRKSAKPLVMPEKVGDEEYQKASTVIFVDEYDNIIGALPPLQFASDKFAVTSTGRVLNAVIEFPVHEKAQQLGAVALVDAKGKPVSVCNMVMPLSICGGRSARISGGSLLFPAPVKPEVEVEAAKAA